ncbi:MULTISPECIES: hypothetical protein [Streptomyces]|uniref:hypothetical protein n=1 Tax=Streptomyces TaxID=1883 RepID=UPI0010727731|nr:hypothetical protein [Streptomyces sp. 4R-3d]TFI24104.1 hypothetical protein E4P36_24735 [Streptomyces sp. 4R-3d]
MRPADPGSSRAVLIGAHTFRHLPPLGPVEANVTRLGRLLTSDDVGGLAPEHRLERLRAADPGDERQLYPALPDSEPTGKWYRTPRYADIRDRLRHLEDC